MFQCLGILCLFVDYIYSCSPNLPNDTKSDPDKNGEPPENVPCSNSLKDLKIYNLSPSPETNIGKNVTLKCYSETGCLPIIYNLFLGNRSKNSHNASQNGGKKCLVFTITIKSKEDLGPYKCKATNSSNGFKYSTDFTFTLRDNTFTLLLHVVLPLLLLLLVIAVAVLVILLKVVPWYKARKLTLANNSFGFTSATNSKLGARATYNAGETDEDHEYCNVEFKTRMNDSINVIHGENTTVNYADVVFTP